jgi:undecaprenyl-diphosphatase
LIIGFLLEMFLGDYLHTAEIVGWNLIVWGIILYVADKIGLTVRRMEHLNAGQALIIGVFQCLAFIPGTSRSAITITVARILGYERIAAARFSFLLSMPAIAAAGLYQEYEFLQAPSPWIMEQVGLMFAVSAVTGFLALAFMMYWLRRSGFAPFVLYRILLGAVVLYLTYRLPGGIEGICSTLN